MTHAATGGRRNSRRYCGADYQLDKRGETFYPSLCIAGLPVGRALRRPHRAAVVTHKHVIPSSVGFGSSRPDTRTKSDARRPLVWACRVARRPLDLRLRVPGKNDSTHMQSHLLVRFSLGSAERAWSEPSSIEVFSLDARVGAPSAKRTGMHADRSTAQSCDNAGLLSRGEHRVPVSRLPSSTTLARIFQRAASRCGVFSIFSCSAWCRLGRALEAGAIEWA
ncbi:hypothetical protein LXA43DRAFT_654122 [Ganoderma leucocontextum]|nr:hypothetical protein LXA43DRAFT_654122 [Ganoderma leucocontextum]